MENQDGDDEKKPEAHRPSPDAEEPEVFAIEEEDIDPWSISDSHIPISRPADRVTPRPSFLKRAVVGVTAGAALFTGGMWAGSNRAEKGERVRIAQRDEQWNQRLAQELAKRDKEAETKEKIRVEGRLRDFLRAENRARDDEFEKTPVAEYKPVDDSVRDVLSLALRLKASGIDGIHFGENHVSPKRYDIYKAVLESNELGVNLLCLEGPPPAKPGADGKELSEEQRKTIAANSASSAKIMDEYHRISPKLAEKEGEFYKLVLARNKPGQDNSLWLNFTGTSDDAFMREAA